MLPGYLPRRLTAGIAALMFCTVSAHAQSDDIIYGANKLAQSAEINLTQQTFNVVGDLEVGTAASDQDPVTGDVYYFEMNVDGGNGNTLRTWDPETGDVTIVRQYNPAPDIYVKKMAFAPDNTLYMADDDDILYSVDKESGDITTLGTVLGMENALGLTGGDMTFTPDGSLYAVNMTNLYYIDIPSLTATTLYTNLLPVPGGSSHFTGVGYCNDSLYAVGMLFSDPFPVDLSTLTEMSVWTIDPATGATNREMQIWPGQPLVRINDVGSCIPELEPDVTPPSVTITSPTSAPTFTTTSSSITVGGNASDDIGVSSVTWTNNRGGSGTASGTDNWSVASIALQPGDNQLTVTASDAAGNMSSDVITVTFDAPDVTPPTVTITSPTSAPTFTTTASSIGLGGTASDDTAVTSVTWVNDRGGSGTATGTDNWSVASIALQPGDNQLTVTASDAAGNTSSDVVDVTREIPNQAPTATIITPSNGATVPVGQALAYSGTASDQEDGPLPESAYTWEAARAGGPFFLLAQGVESGSAVIQVPGTFILRLTVQDSAGLTATDEVTFTSQ